MRTLQTICLTFICLVGLSLAAHAETVAVNVGDTPIEIPAPQGFFRYDGKSARVDQMQLRSVVASNRLLAAFGSKDDLAQTLTDTFPKLERNFSAQSVRQLESTSISSTRFAELKPSLRKEMDSMRDKLGDTIAELESNASTNLSKDYQSRMGVKMGGMILLGVFDETSDSLCYSMLTKYRITSADLDTPVEVVSIVAACALNIRDRVIYLSCTSNYRDKRDIDWARSSVKKWRDDVIAANRPTVSSAP